MQYSLTHSRQYFRFITIFFKICLTVISKTLPDYDFWSNCEIIQYHIFTTLYSDILWNLQFERLRIANFDEPKSSSLTICNLVILSVFRLFCNISQFLHEFTNVSISSGANEPGQMRLFMISKMKNLIKRGNYRW